MRLTYHSAQSTGICYIAVEHNDEILEFSGSTYQGEVKNDPFDSFEQVNRYWERLDKAEQDRMFALLTEARKIFNEPNSTISFIHELRPIVEELITIHDTPSFERWVSLHSGIWVPDGLETVYDDNPMRPGSLDQTYLKGDYWQLAIMLMKMRIIAPIIGEFIEITKRDSGATFRELNAFYLITKHPIMQCDAMKKLERYVSKNHKKDGIDARSSINGIGSDNILHSLIAGIIINTLMMSRLTRGGKETDLVQLTFRSLRNKLSQNDNYKNAVLPKENPGENNDSDEDSSSRAEKYKNKAPIPPGEITALEKYTEFPHAIAARLLLKNELSEEESDALDRILENIPDIDMEECQIQLIRWVIHPIVSARAFWDINKAAVMRLACVAQFVLWNTGFKELAMLVTARSMNAEGYGSYGSVSREQIPKHIVERINELYPYYRRNPKKAVKADNDAIREIIQLSDDLSNHTWFLNIHPEHIAEIRGSALNKTYRLGNDTRTRLANYVIYLQERNASFISLYTF